VSLKVTGYSGNPVDYLQQKLHDLQIKEQDLLSKFKEKNNLVQEVQRQIGEIQALLDEKSATKNQVTNLALINDKAILSELQEKTKALKNELKEAQGELVVLNNYEVKIAALQRNVDILTANYRNYSDKLEQARIDKALNLEKISNISIVQAATLPVKPVKPRKALNLALGMFFGIFGGLGLAFLAESLDHSFHMPEDVVRKLQYPILATIPRFTTNGIKGYLEGGSPMLFPESSAGWDMSAEITKRCELISPDSLCLDYSNRPSQVIAVTSCYSGEGVSTFATNLAANLVRQGGGRVLLVDANMIKPMVHRVFALSQSPGFADLFQDPNQSNGIKPSSIKNLDILPSGQVRVKPGNFLDPTKLFDLISLWKREYRLVVFDVPALNESALIRHLASLVDSTVLVVEAERTRWETAQQAKEILEQAQATKVGVVLNKRQFPIPEWLYRTL
jgi:capsular exopolysaccharide synthesis family protein